MQRSRRVLKRFREERVYAVKQYAGSHYSDDGARLDVPVNLIALYIQIVARNLIPKLPRVMLSTFQKQHKPVVKAMETWANEEMEAMKLANTLERVVVDALFSIGILKVALAAPADSAQVAWNIKPGSAFAKRVDLDDFVYDVHARDFEEVCYIGHRFRVPMDVVKDSKIYSPARKHLVPSTDRPHNMDGDERISAIGRGSYVDMEEYEDFVDLWEVYLPRKRLIVTLADDDLAGPSVSDEWGMEKALRVQDWVGDDSGPYKVLAYGSVPGNAMPNAPIQHLIDLHVAANNVYRKLIRQAQRQKSNTFVNKANPEDAERIKNCSDGDIVPVDNPQMIQQIDQGGPNQQNYAIALELKNLFDFMGGNLSIMGGLSPQSKTASQDKMLNENSSQGLIDKQQRTIVFVSDVMKSLCWYWYNDPYKVMRSTYSLPGLPEMTIDRVVTPMERLRGRFEDLQVKIDPYSMQHDTPQTRLAGLLQIVTQIYAPMAQLAAQQGVSVDLNVLFEKIGKYMDQPDLPEIITYREPPETTSAGNGQAGLGMPQNTERKYVRESTPGRTQKGNDMNMASTMMGVDPGGSPEPSMNGQA